MRGIGAEGSDAAFLGSIRHGHGNWMALNELYAGHNPELISLQLFLLSFKEGQFVESIIGQAVIQPHDKETGREHKAKRNRLSTGMYETKLTTSVRSLQSTAPSTIAIGKVKIHLMVDSGRMMIPYSLPIEAMNEQWITNEIPHLVTNATDHLRVRLFKVVYLLGLIELEDFRKKTQHLAIVDALLDIVIRWNAWTSQLLEDMTAFIVQLQLQQRMLFVLNMYFEVTIALRVYILSDLCEQ